MYLNYLKSGSGPSLIILHGLFGMLDNWKTIGKQLEENFTVYLVDQRNHGKSPHKAEHSYQLMADDLFEFLNQQNIESAIILGHSMGGKTAMRFAFDHAKKVKKLIIVDMGIKRYSAGHDDIFAALHSINLQELTNRQDAEKILIGKINDIGTRQFIMKNLTRNIDGAYAWKFNLQAIYQNYQTEILSPVNSDQPFTGDALFIRGEKSRYILDEDWPSIHKLFPKANLITIENAGHWVHADQPAKLFEAVLGFL